ncbi:TPA: YbhB/YbcL family Raf kinase inhibitor-like protein [Shigella sonnei]
MNPYIYLGGAILAEVIGTTLMKFSEGFTRLWPSVGTIICYCASFWLLAQTLANIPATVTYLPADAGRRDGTKLPTGAVQGRNDFGYAGFGGACPPKGDKPHHYQFKIWALKTDKIPVDSNSSGALVGYMLNANKIATAEIIPVYEVK